MIKINLLVGKKPLDITNVGGFDLSQINLKLLLFAIFLSYVPDWFIYDSFEESIKKENALSAAANKEFRIINKKVKSLKAIEKQIRALELLDKQLNEKLNVVRDIIKINTNPINILLYISKNIPSELWLKEVTIEKNLLKIKGESRSPKIIGNFMDSLKSSIFFRKDVKLPEFKTENRNDVRVEVFTIEATILSYE